MYEMKTIPRKIYIMISFPIYYISFSVASSPHVLSYLNSLIYLFYNKNDIVF